MRTNIVIEDALMQEAIEVSNSSTKKEVVEKALRLLVSVSKQSKIKKFKGELNWDGDLDGSRKD